MRTLLEICVEDAAGLAEAVAGGADRIELCAALGLGGVTPSPGLVDLAVASGVPVHVLIRPRAGGFVLREGECALMLADIREALARGAAGVVVGALERSGDLDRAAMARFREAARDGLAVLHRAIDVSADPIAAVEEACALGYDKILSSGGAPSAIEGAGLLADMVAAARGQLSIIAGAGVRPETVAALVAATGVEEVHASASRSIGGAADKLVRLGFAAPVGRRTDRAIVAALRRRLDGEEAA